MKHKNQEPTIRCTASLGMFTSEREIRVDLADGRKVSALVDKRDVIVEQDPPPGGEVNGRVKVAVVAAAGKNAVIVDLPQGGLTEGPRVTVPKSSLK